MNILDYQAAVFDFDGTIIDSMNMWSEIDIEYLSRYGHEPGPFLHDEIEGMSPGEMAVYFRENYGIPRSDEEMIRELARTHTCIVTMEESVLSGSMGLQVTGLVEKEYPACRVISIALPDSYVEHGDVSVLRQMLKIDSESIVERILKENAYEGEKAAGRTDI